VLRELARIAPRVIVSFRNYGHWRVRWTLLTTGKLPTLGHTPHWWADGARRPCTARDIADLASELGLNLAALTSVDDPGDRERVATKVEAGFASATRSIKDLDRGPDSLGTQRGLRVGSLRRLNWSAEELVAVLDRA
jgi:methionine biosynthesis protein MetW